MGVDVLQVSEGVEVVPNVDEAKGRASSHSLTSEAPADHLTVEHDGGRRASDDDAADVGSIETSRKDAEIEEGVELAGPERLNEAAPRTAAHGIVYVARPKAADGCHYRKRLRVINRAAEDERWQTVLNCFTYERADKFVPILVPGKSREHP